MRAGGLGLYLTDVDPGYALGAGSGVYLIAALLLNSPLGSHVEELVADRAVRGWELVRRDVLPGVYYLVVSVFRIFMERLERMMYAVDEWLRFRTGDSTLSAAVKPVLGLAWFVIAYAVRAVINLFVEPTFNPIKHFPVVTVAAKLLFPFLPTLGPAITVAVQPVLGLWLSPLVAGTLLFFIPGFAGFLVWELKENWRLYSANQPLTLQAEVVGSHGETVLRLASSRISFRHPAEAVREAAPRGRQSGPQAGRGPAPRRRRLETLRETRFAGDPGRQSALGGVISSAHGRRAARHELHPH